MTRWKAAGLHLLASAGILASAAALAMAFWYPPSLFQLSGADRLLIVLAAIDVTVGPLLTLIVYHKDKPGMKLDLATIAILQTAFFAYGLHVFWMSRPVFLVAAVDRVELIFANEVERLSLALAKPPFDGLGHGRPRLVGLGLPPYGPLRNNVMFEEMQGRKATARPEFYRDYAEVVPRLLRNARSVDMLAKLGDDAARKLDSALGRLDKRPEEVRWLPLDSSRGGAVQLVDSRTGMPLATLAIDPWEALAAASRG